MQAFANLIIITALSFAAFATLDMCGLFGTPSVLDMFRTFILSEAE